MIRINLTKKDLNKFNLYANWFFKKYFRKFNR